MKKRDTNEEVYKYIPASMLLEGIIRDQERLLARIKIMERRDAFLRNNFQGVESEPRMRVTRHDDGTAWVRDTLTGDEWELDLPEHPESSPKSKFRFMKKLDNPKTTDGWYEP